MSIELILPEIDKKQTRLKVEEVIETYRLYLLTIPEERLPKITATYSHVPPANTNSFYSATEDLAIKAVDEERKRVRFVEWFTKAINRLAPKEREALYLRYLDEDELFDYEVYNSLGMSESYYHQKFKPRLLLKLAMALNIAIYKDME